jgi:ABC-2 type transport system permease protein
MRTTLTLARYQLRVLLRTPGYWITALLLSALGIVVFGLFLSDPTGTRLGIVDMAQNDASARFLQSAEELDRVDVRLGERDQQIEKLKDGERWAVVILPADFGDDPTLAGVEIWTGDPDGFAALVGGGIAKQLLAESTPDGGAATGIQVHEEPHGDAEPLRFIDIVVPGQVGLSLMFGNLFAAGMLALWRQQGILRRIAASPSRPVHLITSQLLVFGLVSVAQVTILLTIGTLLFGVTIEGSLIALAVTAFAGILAFLSLWYALTAFIRSPIAAGALANLIAFVMMFAGGSYVPIEDPPLLLKPVVFAAPLKYLNDALRDVINSGDGIEAIAPELAVLFGWAGALFAVSMRVFRWTADER